MGFPWTVIRERGQQATYSEDEQHIRTVGIPAAQHNTFRNMVLAPAAVQLVCLLFLCRIPGKKMALTLVGLVLVAAAAGGGSQTFSYADGSTMTVALVGEGDVARVTVVPKGANEDFPRYQGFINATALKVRY